MNLLDFLIDFSLKNYRERPGKNFIEGGTNGLYFDRETPIRNTCHWLKIFKKLYDETGDMAYYNSIEKMSNWLVGDNIYFSGATYLFRDKKGKDESNGLIGPAWTIEGLLASYEALKDKRLLDRAHDILLLHSFDNASGYWTSRVEPSGELLSMDCTLNHQIWFASSVANYLKHAESDTLRSNLQAFLFRLKENVFLYSNGLIFHIVKGEFRVSKNRIRRLFTKNYRIEMKQKEYGYHLFNLLGLTIIEKANDRLSKKLIGLDSALDYFRNSFNLIESTGFKLRLLNNKYAYPYNPCGFEAAVVLDNKNKNIMAQEYIDKQFKKTFDPSTFTFNKTNDVKTLNARVYELTYLSKISSYTVPALERAPSTLLL